MSHSILITSASGNIGSELIRQLQADNLTVIAGSSSGKVVAGVPTRHVDFYDVEGLRVAFAGIDTLFLLLPLVPEKLQLAENAINAAKAAGVKHIVRSSGAGADPSADYALPRLQGEIDQLVIDSGIPFTLVRPATFMQNFAVYYADMIKSGALYLPQGEGRVSYIDVRDIAAVNAVILKNPQAHAGKIYTLTGDTALSNAEVAAAIAEVIERPVAYVAVDDKTAIEAMTSMGMNDWSIAQMMSLHQLTAAGYAAGTTDTVQEILGRAPLKFESFVLNNQEVWQ